MLSKHELLAPLPLPLSLKPVEILTFIRLVMFGKPFAGLKGRSRHLKLPYAPQGRLIGFLLHKYNSIVICHCSELHNGQNEED